MLNPTNAPLDESQTESEADGFEDLNTSDFHSLPYGSPQVSQRSVSSAGPPNLNEVVIAAVEFIEKLQDEEALVRRQNYIIILTNSHK